MCDLDFYFYWEYKVTNNIYYIQKIYIKKLIISAQFYKSQQLKYGGFNSLMLLIIKICSLILIFVIILTYDWNFL
jgi:hypothetical protein